MPNTANHYSNQVLTGYTNFHQVKDVAAVRDEVLLPAGTNESSILSFYNNQPYENRTEHKIPKTKDRHAYYGDQQKLSQMNTVNTSS